MNHKYHLAGTLSIKRAEKLVTILFELQRLGDKQTRSLRDAASGSVDTAGLLTLTRVDAFALTGAIGTPFNGAGQYTDNENNLTLRLVTSRSPQISGNFAASASLQAVSTGPPPADSAFTGKEPQ